MKRSFYEMLGVPHGADQAQIDTAYTLMTARLSSNTSVRGTAEAVSEISLIRDGYRILSDPARRAKYDAKLSAAESGVQLIFFPEGSGARRKLGLETLIFAVLTAVFGGIVYWQLTYKMDEVRIEHTKSIERQRGEQNRPVIVDATKPEPSSQKAVNKEQKR